MIIKTLQEHEDLRVSGQKLAQVMEELLTVVTVGITTLTIDILAEQLLLQKGCVPVLKGYLPYGHDRSWQHTICASVNSDVVHRPPSRDVVLRDGDLLKIDITASYNGMFTDMARTVCVGSCDKKVYDLIDTAKKGFERGISVLKAGMRVMDYAREVERYVEKKRGYYLVRDLVGHGVGRSVHETPQVPNYVDRRLPNPIIKKGQVLALEPMVNQGTHEVYVDKDHWTFKTADGSLSAHWENTVVVWDDGVEVLTRLS